MPFLLLSTAGKLFFDNRTDELPYVISNRDESLSIAKGHFILIVVALCWKSFSRKYFVYS